MINTTKTVEEIIREGAVLTLSPVGRGVHPGQSQTSFMIAEEFVIRDGKLFFYMPGTDYTGGIRSLPWENVEVIMNGYVSRWETERDDITGRAFLNPIEPWEEWAERWKTWQEFLSVPENRARHLASLANDQPEIFGPLVQND